jgi:D-lactate dehydrogenase
VGIAKRDFVSQEIDATTLALMQKIKQQFDPNGILNPGKTLPDYKDVGI